MNDHHETLPDGNLLQIHVADEGLVIDLFNPDGTEVLATFAQTFDELVDTLLSPPRHVTVMGDTDHEPVPFIVRAGATTIRVTTTEPDDLIGIAAAAREELLDTPFEVCSPDGQVIGTFTGEEIDDWWA